jgi:predicted RNA-binding protein with PUA-like domain
VEFIVRVNGEIALSRYLDPKENPEQNRWHEVEVDLAAYRRAADRIDAANLAARVGRPDRRLGRMGGPRGWK